MGVVWKWIVVAVVFAGCCADAAKSSMSLRCKALQQWSEAIVPDQVLPIDKRWIYIREPKSPSALWVGMEGYILEKLAAGKSLRWTIEKLRTFYPDYALTVPRPRVFRVEFLGDANVAGERIVEKEYGSEEKIVDQVREIGKKIERTRLALREVGEAVRLGRRNSDGDEYRDVWRMPVKWMLDGDVVVVRSAGVDTEWNTDDDIVVVVDSK